MTKGPGGKRGRAVLLRATHAHRCVQVCFHRPGQTCTPQLKYLCQELKRFKVQIFFCSLEPEWAAAATEVKEQTQGKVKLAAVDATANQFLASRYGVSVSVRLVSLRNTPVFSTLTSASVPSLPVW